MKILQVVHYYLPNHLAGTEVYTWRLARELAERHEVKVFCAEDAVSGEPGLTRDMVDGHEVIRYHHGQPTRYADTFRNTEVETAFAALLSEWRPDVIHFQHTIRLSASLIPLAKRLGIPVVVTLADYWHICPQVQMLRAPDQPCWGPDAGLACLDCPVAVQNIYTVNTDLPEFVPEHRRGGLLRLLFGLKRILPRPLWRLLRGVYFRLRGVGKQDRDDPENPYRATVDRLHYMLWALNRADTIVCPSRFLYERHREAGVDADKLVVSDYGFATKEYRKKDYDHLESPTSIQFGFVGTPVPHKGLHTLIEAFNGIEDERAYLNIYGDMKVLPNYAAELKALRQNPRIVFKGTVDNERVPRTLFDLDVLIVPSLWWENSPLTIHEAFLAGVPVITGNIGGMAELVPHNVAGLQVEPGNAEALRAAIQKVLDEPSLIERWAKGIPKVKSIEDNAKELEKIYKKLA